MSVIGAVIMPHPPIILPQVGRGREREIQATIDACRRAAALAAQWNPDVLVITSPHTVMYADYFHIAPDRSAVGTLANFGAPQVRMQVEYDPLFRAELIRRAEAAGIHAGTLGLRDPELDHGVMIPLSFLREAGVSCPVIRMGLSGFSPLEHYRLGQCVAQTANALGRRVVLLASGDLSHKLTEDGPYGFAPEGPEFDRAVTAAIAAGDFLTLLTLDPALCQRAAECGLRSFQLMAGALDGLAVEPHLLSYEGPFGVGYGVAAFAVTGRDPARCFAARYQQAEQQRLALRRAGESPFVQLARLSLEQFVRTGHRLEALPENLPPEFLQTSAGAFVSLHLNGQLRGCIGTILPAAPCLGWEILQNAVSAGTEDPRFPPVRPDELERLEYSVDVLGSPEAIDGPEQLDVRRYGVIVSCGSRRGLLLPDLDGVDTAAQQIAIARQKGNIGPCEPYQLQRFEVVRHT